MDKYAGNDNYGKPKMDFVNKLQPMTDEALFIETERSIWLSAFAANNPRSDYHWQVDACYDECVRRGKPELYKAAYDKARATA